MMIVVKQTQTLTYDACRSVTMNVGVLTVTSLPCSSTAVHGTSASVSPSSKFQLLVTLALYHPAADSQVLE